MNRTDKEFGDIISQSYKNPDVRRREMVFKGFLLQYKREFSDAWWATYENDKIVVVAIHGVNGISIETIRLLLNGYIETNEFNTVLQNLKDYHKQLKFDPREVFFTGHSLGGFYIANIEVLNGGSSITGVVFAPYCAEKREECDFIANTTRYKKIFYDNDPVPNFLLKLDLQNAVVFTPKTEPSTFINSHTMSVFLDRTIDQVNLDLLRIYDTTELNKYDLPEPKLDPRNNPQLLKKVNLTVANYNVKMFPSIIKDTELDFRGKQIADYIKDMIQPDVISLVELFDDNAYNKMATRLQSAGYSASGRVGSSTTKTIVNYGAAGKILNGGVCLFSKFPIKDTRKVVYEGGVKEDAQAAKGAVRITIDVNGVEIDVIATHLQSGRKEDAFKVKEEQLAKLDSITTDNPTIIVGDMNIEKNRFQDFLSTEVQKYNWIELENKNSTTNDGITDKDGGNILDYVIFKENDAWDIRGTTQVINPTYSSGYWIDKQEKSAIVTGIVDTSVDALNVVEGLFESKKKHRKHKKKRKKATGKIFVHSLSDHKMIIGHMEIEQKLMEGTEVVKKTKLKHPSGEGPVTLTMPTQNTGKDDVTPISVSKNAVGTPAQPPITMRNQPNRKKGKRF